MNILKRIRGGFGGASLPAPPLTPPAEAAGLPCYCPECGSENASETTEWDRRSTRISCPDCGLSRKTELLR